MRSVNLVKVAIELSMIFRLASNLLAIIVWDPLKIARDSVRSTSRVA
jgi:hypothetical protein